MKRTAETARSLPSRKADDPIVGHWVVAAAISIGASVARADTPTTITPENWPTQWVWEPGIVAGLFVMAALYFSGLRWLRRATRAPHKLGREARWFWSGWFLLAIALLSPIHPLGELLFSAHMTQHELLMVAAAPLLMLGRPGLVWLWALPRQAARRMTIALRSTLGAGWHWRRSPLAAFAAQAVALWLWHTPRFYDTAVEHPAVHGIQHLCFVASSMWFWDTVFFGPRRMASYGIAVLYLFATAVHSGALGALITFAGQPLYPHYATLPPTWGMTPLEDQELGGLIMWVPAGLAYVIAALTLFAAWMRASEPAKAAAVDRHVAVPLEPGAKCMPSPTS